MPLKWLDLDKWVCRVRQKSEMLNVVVYVESNICIIRLDEIVII